MRLLLFMFVLFFNLNVFSQTGTIKGNIKDGEYNSPLIGATVTLKDEPSKGVISDIDGNYLLELNEGTYDLKFSFISYETQIIKVIIKEGETTNLDVVMRTSSQQLEMVEIVTEIRKNTEVATLLEMKKSVNVSDILSSQSFRKVGDNNLSSAIRRVTGVTVQDNKYVYVRGLGDRYVKTTINGMTVPGLDPDVNSLQISLFPTSILENVSVYKTFSPNLYSDFTGGLVNIETKKFTDSKLNRISFSLGYIPNSTLVNDFISYENSSKLSILGYPGRSRKLQYGNIDVPNIVLNDPKSESITRSFDPILSTKLKTSLPNMSFSFLKSNKIEKEKYTLGYNIVFNYSTNNVLYRNYQQNRYLKPISSEDYLEKFIGIEGNVSQEEVLWSSLLSTSFKKDNHELNLTFLNIQNGVTSSSDRINQDYEQTNATLVEDILTYSARTLNNTILTGEHKFNNILLKWGNSFSYSRVFDPDFRETRISITDGDTTLNTGDGAGIDRFWRDLNEINESFKVDLEIELKNNKIETGLFSLYKNRDFEILNYKHRYQNKDNISIELNPNWFLAEDNIWEATESFPNNNSGTYTIGSYNKQNSFRSHQTSISYYVMDKFSYKIFNAVFGARIEKNDMYYSGENNSGTIAYYDEQTLDILNILPSVNMILNLTEKMNLRLSTNKTIALPTFREKSISQIYDPISKRTFVGNLDLTQTEVWNYDLRYEYFITPSELFAISPFYKQFDAHIELTSNNLNPNEMKPRNTGESFMYGVEFELRKNIKDFSISTNIILLDSKLDITDVEINNEGVTEYDSRLEYARDGENISPYRRMTGQSPYSFNLNLNYKFDNANISVAYNIQGEQLSIVGSERVPDIYTLPFNSLNLNVYKDFNDHRLTLSANNILNDDRIMVYRSFNTEEIFNRFYPGILFKFKYSFSF